jgi:hypothetical protein
LISAPSWIRNCTISSYPLEAARCCEDDDGFMRHAIFVMKDDTI